MNKKQKKIFFCVCMIFFLFLIVTIYLLKQKSPYEYLKEQKGIRRIDWKDGMRLLLSHPFVQ